MIINGEKFACQSCVKGHRVSNCNHTDRPLQSIAPKGRPVKQCDHCRDARKAKSHHTKCDCGSKRKDKAKGESKSEEHSCCCHKGAKCVCGNKAEAMDLRLETTLSRPTLPVKSKPKLITSNSETSVPVLSGGPQRPLHRHNHSASMSGQPYQIPRPHSLHGSGAFAQAARKNSDVVGRAFDDMMILDGCNEEQDRSDDAMGARNVHGTFSVPLTAIEPATIDWEKFISSGDNNSIENNPATIDQTANNASGWFETNWNAISGASIDFAASPNFIPTTANLDLSIPSAPMDFFSPADLPLTSNPANPAYQNYVQPISNSGESGFQSLPGLTTASSNAQSEAGELQVHTDNETLRLWGDASAARNVNMYQSNTRSTYGNFAFSGAEDLKPRPISHHSDAFSFDTVTSAQSDRVSESSTIVPTSATANSMELNGVNAGHMENLATLRSLEQAEGISVGYESAFTAANPISDFSTTTTYATSVDFSNLGFNATGHDRQDEFESESEPTSRAIIIPAGSDDVDDTFSWSYSSATQPSTTTAMPSDTVAAAVAISNDASEYDWLR